MKKYYLVITDIGMEKGQNYEVYVSDSSQGAIFEFEASNYTEAQKKIKFVKNVGNGEIKIL